MSLFSHLRKTRDSLGHFLSSATKRIDEEILNTIEEALIQSDCGLETTDKIREHLHKKKGEWQTLLSDALSEIFTIANTPSDFNLIDEINQHQKTQKLPYTILMIGVNGAGKTTTIGKLCHLLNQHHKRTLLASADTFRAAASEQLAAWADRSGADIISGHSKDPSAMIYTTIEKGAAEGYDVIIADTAGRQFNQQGLMNELEKMHRSAHKFSPQLPHQTWLVLDAGSGQNGVHQARAFGQILPITGCIITKLDGSAKGGMILSIVDQLKLPIYYLGTGEKIDQLIPFNTEEFIQGFIPSSSL